MGCFEQRLIAYGKSVGIERKSLGYRVFLKRLLVAWFSSRKYRDIPVFDKIISVIEHDTGAKSVHSHTIVHIRREMCQMLQADEKWSNKLFFIVPHKVGANV